MLTTITTIYYIKGQMATISPFGHSANLLLFSDFIVKNVKQFSVILFMSANSILNLYKYLLHNLN